VNKKGKKETPRGENQVTANQTPGVVCWSLLAQNFHRKPKKTGNLNKEEAGRVNTARGGLLKSKREQTSGNGEAALT